MLLAWALASMLCLVRASYAGPPHREHKVHNIVLYPDKHSWCSRTPIKQVVGQPGCEPVEVENSVCVGGCFSYSIPRTEPQAPGEVQPYCDSCQPSTTTWKHVTLTCNSGEYEGETLTKKVEIIEDCICSACSGRDSGAGGGHGANSAGGPESSGVELPQLLNLVHSKHPHTAPPPPNEHNIDLDHITNKRLAMLLKVLSGNDEEDAESVDQEELENIISDIRGSDPHIDHNMIESIAHKAEELGHIKVDMVKLRLLLSKFEAHLNANQTQPELETEGGDTAWSEMPHRHGHGNPHHISHHSKMVEDEEPGEPTLDVAHHHLKPAYVGAEITYHGHVNHHVPKDEPELPPNSVEDDSE